MGDNALLKTDTNVLIMKHPTRQFTKSKYKIAYADVPVMLQLDFSEPGERDESFTIGAGGYAGVRMSASVKQKYSSDIYQDAKEKRKDSFFTNQFRYGLMGQIGFGSFKITTRYDLNSYFQEGKGPNYQIGQVSIGWTL
ncbi:MAG: outer membrane beta-barrel protein [Owenweeksia sp.]|nr:outer membrane beta-barrel protein [Owenweeksia sp.]